jgi:signal transduction histidine kinase
MVIPNTLKVAYLRALWKDNSARTLLCVPLTIEDRRVGTLVLAREARRGFTGNQIALTQSIARQLGGAVRNGLMRQQMTLIKERQRISRDLHDSAAQALYGLVTYVEVGRLQIEMGDVDGVRDTLSEVGNAVREAIKELRLLIHHLNPPVLEKEGLLGALRQRLATVEGRSDVHARLMTKGAIELSLSVQTTLYRIAQEALNNVLRHSGATNVTVRLSRDGETTVLEVVDDGRGFHSHEVSYGIGLRSMSSRAAQIGAILEILSRPGGGTVVRVILEESDPFSTVCEYTTSSARVLKIEER